MQAAYHHLGRPGASVEIERGEINLLVDLNRADRVEITAVARLSGLRALSLCRMKRLVGVLAHLINVRPVGFGLPQSPDSVRASSLSKTYSHSHIGPATHCYRSRFLSHESRFLPTSRLSSLL